MYVGVACSCFVCLFVCLYFFLEIDQEASLAHPYFGNEGNTYSYHYIQTDV